MEICGHRKPKESYINQVAFGNLRKSMVIEKMEIYAHQKFMKIYGNHKPMEIGNV